MKNELLTGTQLLGKSKAYFVLVIVMMSITILSFGCSRTVTPLPVVGNQLVINITFRDTVNTEDNKYYLIFGNINPSAPYRGTYANTYFFAPGEDYDTNKMNVSTDVSYYYTNYFSTWNDFILLKNNVYYITNGPFKNAFSHNTYKPEYLDVRTPPTRSDESKKISFSFYFSKLSTLPEELYFNIICVDNEGYLKDYLRATDNKISVNQGTTISERIEPSDTEINGSFDIVSWDMKVQ